LSSPTTPLINSIVSIFIKIKIKTLKLKRLLC
jgi:hypothetical protein